ncbi:MAG: sulfur-oxidizing protein SoxX [Gammaproteobacteria bacterium]|jgi:sulfur-oxidizing protein SoxX
MYDTLTRKLPSIRNLSLAVVLVSLVSGVTPSIAGDSPEYVAEGKKLAFSRKKGNCLACHAMDDGTLAGNGGPPLVAMKARFPSAKALKAQIWDATERNPDSIMPPFGRHGILSNAEIDKIAAYVHTL